MIPPLDPELSSKDWGDVADLLEQSGVMAEDSKETHTLKACNYVRKAMIEAALQAQAYANG